MIINGRKYFVWPLVIIFLLTQIFITPVIAQSAEIGPGTGTGKDRIAGVDGYKTAVAVSQKGWETSDYAVLAKGDDFADALCAGPLAQKYGGPILLTQSNQLNADTLTELKRLEVKHLFIAGGSAAISQSIEDNLQANGIATIERIAGYDRYETSVKIAQKIGNTGKVVLAPGGSFPDALSISGIAAQLGMPILLTDRNTLPASVSSYFQTNTVTQTYVVGGTAVISEIVANSVPAPSRLAGIDRYATNVAIMQNFISELNFDNIYVATGTNFVDALTGGVLAAKSSSPLVLTGQSLPTLTANYLQTKLRLSSKILGLGGTSVVPSAVLTGLVIAKEQIPVEEKYSTAGTYGPDTGTKTIQGSVIISARDVTLKNTIIEGDLLLGGSIGDGNVTLRDVTVKGKTIINGGGPNSIIMYNFNGQTVVVDVPDGGNVRLVAQGTTSIAGVSMESDGTLEATGSSASGFVDVAIPEGVQVTFIGAFAQVNVEARGANVTVASGSIASLTIAENAAGTGINLASGTSITTLNANAQSNITGQGQITTANVNTSGVTIEQTPTNTTVVGDRTAKVGGILVTGTNNSPSGGGGGGDSGNYIPALAKVTNVTLDGSGVATWTDVANEASYDVQLYKGGAAQGPAVNVGAGIVTTNVLSAMRTAGAGDYTVKVVAKGDGTSYLDGAASDASVAQTILQLATVSAGLTWTGNVAHWSTVENAVSYDVQLYKEGTASDAPVNVLAVNAATGADFASAISTAGAGTYTYKVTAKGNATLSLDAAAASAASGNNIKLPALAKVTNVTLDGSGIATWTDVANEASYDVQLYKGGAAQGPAVNVGSGIETTNVLSAMRNAGAGDYTVKVVAKGDGTSYLDGAASDASAAQTIIQLETVSAGLTWAGNVAHWSTVENAVSYDVQLYKDGTASDALVNVLAVNAATGADFASAITTAGAGTYTYKVTAKGNATLILDAAAASATSGDNIKLPALAKVTGVALDGSGVATWTDVANEASYDIQLYKGEAAQGPVVNVVAGTVTTNLLSAMRTAGAGEYTVKVIAKGDGTSYLDGAASDASATQTIIQLATVSAGLTWTGNVTLWSTVENAVSYDVQLYKDGTASDAPVNVLAVNAATGADFAAAITTAGAGTYTYKVTAKGNANLILDAAVASAASSNNIKLPALAKVTNVTLDGSGVATWTDVDNEASYDVKLYKGVAEVTTVNVGAGIVTTNLLSAMRNAGAGEYTVKVVAKGDGTSYLDGAASDASAAQTIIQLATVNAGLTWTGNVAHWTTVPNAVSYDVQLYKDGTASGSAVNVLTANAATGADFAAAITTAGAGTYTYKVTAKGNANLILDAAAASAASSNNIKLPALAKVTNVTLDGSGVATWTDVANEASYDIQLYKGEAAQGPVVNVVAGTVTTNVLSAMRMAGAGEYTVKVVAKGDGTSYLDGAASDASATQTIIQLATVSAGLTWTGNVTHWSTVENAVSYDVQLYKEGTASDAPVNVLAVNAATGLDFASAITTAGAGTYTYKVTAKGNATLILDAAASSASDNNIKLPALAKVTNVTLDGSGVATWTDVANEASYDIQLYKGEAAQGPAVNVGSGIETTNVLSAMRMAGAGEYTVKVVAKSDGTSYLDGAASDASATQTIIQLATVSAGLTWAGNVAHWSTVENAVSYDVQLYKDGTASDALVNVLAVNAATGADFASAISTAGAGTYTYKVTAKGNANLILDAAAASAASSDNIKVAATAITTVGATRTSPGIGEPGSNATVDGGANYTHISTVWSGKAGTNYAAGETPVAVITLAPKDGYTFAGLLTANITVTGGTVTYASGQGVQGGGTSVVFTVSYPQLASAASFTGLTANGTTGTVTTTQLTLTFNVDPTTLTASNITVTGATRGALTGGPGLTRTLAISNITVVNGANVTVAIANPAGFTITSASKTVQVWLATPAFTMIAVGTEGTNYTIPTGSGSDTAIVTGGYQMAETETTYELWYAVRAWALLNGYAFSRPDAGAEGSTLIGSFFNQGVPTAAKNEPVTKVSWRDTIVWLNALSEMKGLQPVYRTTDGAIIRDSRTANIATTLIDSAVQTYNNGYRLPISMEWEMAARWIGTTDPNTSGQYGYGTPLATQRKTTTVGGIIHYWTPGLYVTGTTIELALINDTDLQKVAVYQDKTANVKSKVNGANALGLYDLSGNVAEWQFTLIGSDRVYRGGNWKYERSAYLQVGTEFGIRPDFEDSGFGFRIARTPYAVAANAANLVSVATVKGLVAGATYTMAQADATSEAAVKTAVETKIATLALNDVTTVVTAVHYTPATAGVEGTPAGTNGTYTFTVALSKGAGATLATDTTATLTMTVTAAAYVVNNASITGAAWDNTYWYLMLKLQYVESSSIFDLTKLTYSDGDNHSYTLNGLYSQVYFNAVNQGEYYFDTSNSKLIIILTEQDYDAIVNLQDFSLYGSVPDSISAASGWNVYNSVDAHEVTRDNITIE